MVAERKGIRIESVRPTPVGRRMAPVAEPVTVANVVAISDKEILARHEGEEAAKRRNFRDRVVAHSVFNVVVGAHTLMPLRINDLVSKKDLPSHRELYISNARELAISLMLQADIDKDAIARIFNRPTNWVTMTWQRAEQEFEDPHSAEFRDELWDDLRTRPYIQEVERYKAYLEEQKAKKERQVLPIHISPRQHERVDKPRYTEKKTRPVNARPKRINVDKEKIKDREVERQKHPFYERLSIGFKFLEQNKKIEVRRANPASAPRPKELLDAFDNFICTLRRQGLTNEQILEEYGQSYEMPFDRGDVQRSVERLMKEHRIESLKASPDEFLRRQDVVKREREAGLSITAICGKYGWSRGEVGYYFKKLIDRKIIEPKTERQGLSPETEDLIYMIRQMRQGNPKLTRSQIHQQMEGVSFNKIRHAFSVMYKLDKKLKSVPSSPGKNS